MWVDEEDLGAVSMRDLLTKWLLSWIEFKVHHKADRNYFWSAYSGTLLILYKMKICDDVLMHGM